MVITRTATNPVVLTGPEARTAIAEHHFALVKAGKLGAPSEIEIITTTLKVANLANGSDEDARFLYWWFLVGRRGKKWFEIDADNIVRRLGIESIRTELAFVRDAVSQPLELILCKPRTARLRFATTVTGWLERLEFRSVKRFAGNTVGEKFSIVSPTTASAPNDGQSIVVDILLPLVAWALALLMDKNREYGRKLRRCRLPGCGNFFLSESDSFGGRPSPYCSNPHMQEARRLKQNQRQHNYRARTAARHK